LEEQEKKVKLGMHDVMAKPALQRYDETWVLREKNMRRIEAFEMRSLHTLAEG
jgi:hypothetical protein